MRTNWAGNLTYRAAVLHRPQSLDELQRIVAAAPRLRVLGARHSFNDIADTAGAQVSLEALPRRVRIDAARRQVTVDGGIRYGDLARALHAEGWALHNMASLPQISVAGAVATATHGSGSALGNLATAVAAVEVVGPDGTIRRIARGDAGFGGAAVSLGALGPVVGLTLDIEPAYRMRQTVYLGLTHDRLAAEFEAVFAAGTSVSVFTDWRGERTLAMWVKDRLAEGAGPAPQRLFGAEAAAAPQHPLPGGPAAHCTGQMGEPGPWHERLPHFRMDFTPSDGAEIQAEYFLPRDRAAEAVAAMRRLGDRLAQVLMVSEVRTVAADDLWLSPSRGRPYLGLHFTFRRDSEAVRAVLPALEAELAPLDALPHWGKVFAMAPGTVAARLPRLRDFRALAESLDPAGKFRNGFLRRMVFGGM